MANIRLPLVVLPDGNFEPMSEYITMDIEPCMELPEKKDTSSFYNEINGKIFSMCSVLEEKTPSIPISKKIVMDDEAKISKKEIVSISETNPSHLSTIAPLDIYNKTPTCVSSDIKGQPLPINQSKGNLEDCSVLNIHPSKMHNVVKNPKKINIITKEEIELYRNTPQPKSDQKTLKVFQKRSFANKTAKRMP